MCKAEDVSTLSRAEIESALTRLICDHILPGAAGLNVSISAMPSHAVTSIDAGRGGRNGSIAVTLAGTGSNPDNEAALKLLEDNRHELQKIFDIYARREPWLPLRAWVQFGTDFELSNFLSKNALVRGTLHYGFSSVSCLLRRHICVCFSMRLHYLLASVKMSVVQIQIFRAAEDAETTYVAAAQECISLDGFLNSLRHLALFVATANSTATHGDSGVFRTTASAQRQRLRWQTDPIEAVEALLGMLQHSGGIEKLKRRVGRNLIIDFHGRSKPSQHPVAELHASYTGSSKPRDTTTYIDQIFSEE